MTNYQSFTIGTKILIIEKHKLFWENKIFSNLVENPTEIKYYTSPIQIDLFTIGTKYSIDVRNETKDKITTLL